MSRRPRILRNVAAIRHAIERYRDAGDKIALVPTMGALHDGHISLVRAARRRARRVVVSIFVNPAQFAPHEDFARYPRTFARDISTLAREKVDLVWAPSTETMYPNGFATHIEPQGPAKVGLEDRFRPHFFGGVATVVSKLLLQCRPDVALFGQKDYQQLCVVIRLARDLDLPVKIIGAPTVREKDGLALSSRNAYLSASDRAAAPALYRALKDCAKRIRNGSPIGRALAKGRVEISRAGFALDYLEARDARTLEPVSSRKGHAIRLLVAGRIGRTRLIDNIAV